MLFEWFSCVLYAPLIRDTSVPDGVPNHRSRELCMWQVRFWLYWGILKRFPLWWDPLLPSIDFSKWMNPIEMITRTNFKCIFYHDKLLHKTQIFFWLMEKTIVNMMVYKEPGNSFIDPLQVIDIYEADLSFLLGCKWKEALNHNINEETLHQGQYWGLKGRDCTQITLLEELQLDYSLLTRTPFRNFDNNTTVCYDRILVALSSLATQKYSIWPQVVFVHAATLEEAIYKLKLSSKISEEGYKHCTVFPIGDTG